MAYVRNYHIIHADVDECLLGTGAVVWHHPLLFYNDG